MSVFIVLRLLVLTTCSSLPPSLAQVQDDTDVPDAAFVDLVEYVRTTVPDESVETTIEHAAVIADPGRYRGVSVTVTGRLEQHRSLGRPFEGVEEWFVRDDTGVPWVAYVIGADPSAVRDGRGVVLTGVLYKRMRLRDRSGVQRTYPALVASPPVWFTPSTPPLDGFAGMWLLLAVLVVGLLVVVALGRNRVRRSSSRPAIVAADEDDDVRLPEEPSEALRELKRRGDSKGS